MFCRGNNKTKRLKARPLFFGFRQVVTEDSDMLTYGCPRVLFKMDKSGDGQEICMTDLAQNRELNFVGFTPQMFLEVQHATHSSRGLLSFRLATFKISQKVQSIGNSLRWRAPSADVCASGL